MTSTPYWQLLKDPRWQRKRLEIFHRDNFTCRLCGDKESTLNVHHLDYEKSAAPWEYPDTFLITTCQSCHEEMHLSKFGARIVQALIDGGAQLTDLFCVMSAFQSLFNDGPDQEQINRERWEGVGEIIYAAIAALRKGVPVEEIDLALSRLCGEKNGQNSHN